MVKNNEHQEQLEKMVNQREKRYRQVIAGTVLVLGIFLLGIFIYAKNRDKTSVIGGQSSTSVSSDGQKLISDRKMAAKFEAKENEFRFKWDMKAVETLSVNDDSYSSNGIEMKELIKAYGKPSSVEYYNDYGQDLYIFQYDKSSDPRYESRTELTSRQNVRIGFEYVAGAYRVESVICDYLAYDNLSDYRLPSKEEFDSFLPSQGNISVKALIEKLGYPDLYTKDGRTISMSYANYPSQFIFIFKKDGNDYYLDKKNYYNGDSQVY